LECLNKTELKLNWQEALANLKSILKQGYSSAR